MNLTVRPVRPVLAHGPPQAGAQVMLNVTWMKCFVPAEGFVTKRQTDSVALLIAGFKTFFGAYDRDCASTRHGQLQYHVETIRHRRRHGSAKAALADEAFQGVGDVPKKEKKATGRFLAWGVCRPSGPTPHDGAHERLECGRLGRHQGPPPRGIAWRKGGPESPRARATAAAGSPR